MPSRTHSDTDELLTRAGHGDKAARSQLLARHRSRLRRMVAVRLDPRLAARVDPSDVVQDTLAEAHRRLDGYLSSQAVPFYPWLRQLAQDRLTDLYRRHVRAARRSVGREEPAGPALSDASVAELTDRLSAAGPGPSEAAHRREQSALLRVALSRLPDLDREVLILRHLEHLAPGEIAEVLGVPPAVVYTRHLRALRRLRSELGEEGRS
jgi:RNA polymerase sigma-70 factor (ECF subfamily)